MILRKPLSVRLTWQLKVSLLLVAALTLPLSAQNLKETEATDVAVTDADVIETGNTAIDEPQIDIVASTPVDMPDRHEHENIISEEPASTKSETKISESETVETKLNQLVVEGGPAKEIKVFRLINTDAAEIAELVDGLFRDDGVNSEAETRANSVIVVGPKDALRKIEALLIRLDESETPRTRSTGKENTEGKMLHEKWRNLGPVQVEMITRRHLNGLMRAAHGYHEEYGTLPPAAVPNPNLSPDKRLSGLVLLLPYFDQESWFETGRKSFEHNQIVKAKALYNSIDLTKAWDAPVNRKAGKILVSAFLAPGSGKFFDRNGYAVSNFALVRGFGGRDNGIFTDTPIKISDVTDGTSATLAIGQINSSLGPWIAAGLSTSRHMYPPSQGKNPSFGSPFKGAAFFAFGDSSTHLIDIERTQPKILEGWSTRNGSELSTLKDMAVYRTGYGSIEEWKNSRKTSN